MTQENKQLLLKDLCARLPYKVIIKSVGETKIIGLWDLKDVDNLPLPYLRSISSMTEEEKVTYSIYHDNPLNIGYGLIDWLNSRHFDYRGLIPKGLALKAPKDMYKTL